MWSDHSHLHLGGMLGESGTKMRRISGQLKLDVVAAADESMGKGITKASQLLVGMGVQADSSSPWKRSASHLSVDSDDAAEEKKAKATSMPSPLQYKMGSRCETFRAYNYYLSARHYFRLLNTQEHKDKHADHM